MSNQVLDSKVSKANSASSASNSAESVDLGDIIQFEQKSELSPSSKSLKQLKKKGDESSDKTTRESFGATNLLLGGSKSMGATFNEMTFGGLRSGKESTFTLIEKKVKDFQVADPGSKAAISDQIISLSNKWLDKKVGIFIKKTRREFLREGSLSQDDTLKGKSLLNIVKAFENQKKQLSDKSKIVPEITIDRGASSEKSTKGRIFDAIGIDRSITKDIDKAYIDYQTKLREVTSFKDFLDSIQAMKFALDKVKQWGEKNGGKKNNEYKVGLIQKISSSLTSTNFDIQFMDKLVLKLGGFNAEEVLKGQYNAKFIKINGQFSQGSIEITGSKIKIDGSGFVMSDSNLKISAFDKALSAEVSVQNLIYNSNELQFGDFNYDFNILNNHIKASATDVRLTNDRLKWNEIKASGFDINLSFLQVSGTNLTIDGSYNFNIGGSVAMNLEYNKFNLDTKLNLNIDGNLSSKDIPDQVRITDGMVTLKRGDTEIEVKGIEYDKSSEALKAATADAKSKVLGIELKGNATDITILNGKVEIGSGELSSHGDINVGPVTVSSLKVGIKKGDAGYDISGSTELSATSLSVSGVTVESASGKLEFEQKDEKWDIKLSDGSFDISIGSNLSIEARGVSYDYSKESLGAETASITYTGFKEELKGSVNNVSIDKEKNLSFSEATITKERIDLTPIGIAITGGSLTISKEGETYGIKTSGKVALDAKIFGFDVESSLKIEASGTTDGKPNEITVKDGLVTLKRGETEIEVKDIGYDKSSNALTAATADAKSKVLGIELKGNATDITILNGKVEIGSGELSSQGDINVGPVTVSSLKVGIKKGDAGYDISGSTELSATSLSVSGVTVESASGKLEFEQKGENWDISLKNTNFDISLFNKKISINAQNVNLNKDNELKVKKSTVTVLLPKIGEKKVEIKDLQLTKEKIDWTSVSIQIGSLDVGPGLRVNADSAELKGSKENYSLKINKVGASFSYSYLSAGGDVSVSWNFIDGETPLIDSGDLNIESKGIKPLSEGIIPSKFKIGTTVPFFAGPVPMEAGGSFEIVPKIELSLGGKIHFNKNIITIESKNNIRGTLKIALEAELGVGNSFTIYVGGWLKGEVGTNISTELEFDGKLIKKEPKSNYELVKLDLNYDLNAQIKAALKAGLRVKALYIFSKDIYEIEIAEWDLGEATKEGKYNFINKEFDKEDKKGILNISSTDDAKKFFKEKPVKADSPSELVQSKDIDLKNTIDGFTDDKISSNSIFDSTAGRESKESKRLNRSEVIDLKLKALEDSILSEETFIEFETNVNDKLSSLVQNYKEHVKSINERISEYNSELGIYSGFNYNFAERSKISEKFRFNFESLKSNYNKEVEKLSKNLGEIFDNEDYQYFIKESILAYKVNKHKKEIISGSKSLKEINDDVEKSYKKYENAFSKIVESKKVGDDSERIYTSKFLDTYDYPRTSLVKTNKTDNLSDLSAFRELKIIKKFESETKK